MKSEELKIKLSQLQSIASNNNDLSQSLYLHDDVAFSFNGSAAMIIPLETNIKATINLKLMEKFINKTKPNDEIKLSISNKELVIECKNKKAGITIYKYSSEPLKLNEPEEWIELKNDFIEAVKLVYYTTIGHSSDPVDNYIAKSINIKKSYIEAADGFRMTRVFLEKPYVEALVGNQELIAIAKFNPTHVGIANGFLQFKNSENSRYCIRLHNYSYPDLDQVIKDEGEEIELPPEIHQGIEWALTATEKHSLIKVSIEDNLIKVRGESAPGWAEETIETSHQGKNLSFIANATFLKQLLSIGNRVFVNETQLIIKNEKVIHVVMLAL